jgi:ATP synthase protein I
MHGAEITRPPAQRVTLVQGAVLVFASLALYSWNPVVAQSTLLGGLIAVVPQAWFTHMVFRRRGARAATQIARTSYAAEVGKFLMSIAGFALVFALVRPITGWAVFAAYGVMVIIQVTGAWYLLRAAPPGNR